MFMNLVCWLTVGLVAGLVAGKFVNQPGNDLELALGLGAVGAALWRLLHAYFTATGINAFNAGSFRGAVAGRCARHGRVARLPWPDQTRPCVPRRRAGSGAAVIGAAGMH